MTLSLSCRKDSPDYQLMPEVELDTKQDILIEKEVYSSFNGQRNSVVKCHSQVPYHSRGMHSCHVYKRSHMCRHDGAAIRVQQASPAWKKLCGTRGTMGCSSRASARWGTHQIACCQRALTNADTKYTVGALTLRTADMHCHCCHCVYMQNLCDETTSRWVAAARSTCRRGVFACQQLPGSCSLPSASSCQF